MLIGETEKNKFSGFTFERDGEYKVLTPAEKFEDEEEEEEISSVNSGFEFRKEAPSSYSAIKLDFPEKSDSEKKIIDLPTSQSYPEEIAEEIKNQEDLKKSIAEIETKADEENSQEKTEESSEKILELNIDDGKIDSEKIKSPSEDSDDGPVEIKIGIQEDKNNLSVEPISDSESFSPKENEYDQKNSPVVNEEPKLLDDGDKNEIDEITPIPINISSSSEKNLPKESDDKKLETVKSLEEKLEQELKDQELNNPDLVKVIQKTSSDENLPKDTENEIVKETENEVKIEIGITKPEENPINLSREKEEPSVEPLLEKKEIFQNQKENPAEELGREIIESFNNYKNVFEETDREKIISKLGIIMDEFQEKEKNIAPVFEKTLKSFYLRMIFLEEKDKIEAKEGKINLAPLSQMKKPEDINEEEFSYQKFLFSSLEELENIEMEERSTLKSFFIDLAEYLRFKIFEEKEDDVSEDVKLKKESSRDELGKVIINIAKEEMEKNGFVPEESSLRSIYDKEFGDFLKSCSLFDLEILRRANKEILDVATRKDIKNIVLLTSSLENYLKEKIIIKEDESRKYISESLQKKVVA